jgi:hypothetical protein
MTPICHTGIVKPENLRLFCDKQKDLVVVGREKTFCSLFNPKPPKHDKAA